MASMGATISLTGDRRLMRRLTHLKASTQRKVVRPAASKAWTPVNKEAKRRCPKETGALERSLGKKIKVYSRTGVVWVAIGPRTGEKYHKVGPDGKIRKPTKYAHLAEFGGRRSSGAGFMRGAFDTKRHEAEQILHRETWANIQKEARRR